MRELPELIYSKLQIQPSNVEYVVDDQGLILEYSRSDIANPEAFSKLVEGVMDEVRELGYGAVLYEPVTKADTVVIVITYFLGVKLPI